MREEGIWRKNKVRYDNNKSENYDLREDVKEDEG